MEICEHCTLSAEDYSQSFWDQKNFLLDNRLEIIVILYEIKSIFGAPIGGIIGKPV
jgi:hypothetical protein